MMTLQTLRRGLPAAGVLLFITLFRIGAFCRVGSGPATTSVSPLWTSQVIHQPVHDHGLALSLYYAKEWAGIAFLDDSSLLVYEIEHDAGRPALHPRTSFVGSSRLSAYVLDTASGKVSHTREWATRPRQTSVHIASGGILVRSGDVLRMYSKKFVLLRQLTIPFTAEHPWWRLDVSASGRTVLINQSVQEPKHRSYNRLYTLDGTTLKVRQVSIEPVELTSLYSISDQGIAITNFNNRKIVYRDFNSPTWRPLPITSRSGPLGLPSFLSDREISLGTYGLRIVSTDGKVLFTDELPAGRGSMTDVAVARKAQIAAVALGHNKGSDFWDTGHGIHLVGIDLIVDDLSAKRRVLTLHLPRVPKGNFDFALSPDGSRLAVLVDQTVSLYSVPVR